MNAQAIHDLMSSTTENLGVSLTAAPSVEFCVEFARLFESKVRDRIAKPLEDSAARLTAGKRTNQVDRHTADVLATHAERIPADGPTASFVDQCLNGTAQPDTVDDFVERWHAGAGADVGLRQFLGMTVIEYSRWMHHPGALTDILDARRGAVITA
jgi:hypothetical protein